MTIKNGKMTGCVWISSCMHIHIYECEIYTTVDMRDVHEFLLSAVVLWWGKRAVFRLKAMNMVKVLFYRNDWGYIFDKWMIYFWKCQRKFLRMLKVRWDEWINRKD